MSDKKFPKLRNKSETPMNIGKSIKFVRVAASMKQGKMAKLLGVTQNYLSLLENDKAEPSLSLLKKISDQFNVPISFLLVEGTVDFKSDKPEVNGIYQQLHNLIYQLQQGRISETPHAKSK